MKKDKDYRLVIKRGNKDYIPLEWTLASTYEGEDLTTLEGIDTFTTKSDIPELFQDIIDKAIIEPEEKVQDVSIIFFEKGNVREVPHGAIFSDLQGKVNPDTVINFIAENIQNKQLMNKVFNSLNKYQGIKPVDQLRLLLQNIDLFLAKGERHIRVALESTRNIDYEILRNIVLYIELTLKPELEEEKAQKKTFKNNEQPKG